MAKIYISLPISTPGYDEAIQRRIARMWQRYFENEKHIVTNPFDIGDRLEQIHKDCKKPKPTWEQYMKEDIESLANCDTIFLCNGWTQSKGCLCEAEYATQKLNLNVITEKGYRYG